MKKKIFIVIIILLLVIFAFAGCSDNNQSNGSKKYLIHLYVQNLNENKNVANISISINSTQLFKDSVTYSEFEYNLVGNYYYSPRIYGITVTEHDTNTTDSELFNLVKEITIVCSFEIDNDKNDIGIRIYAGELKDIFEVTIGH